LPSIVNAAERRPEPSKLPPAVATSKGNPKLQGVLAELSQAARRSRKEALALGRSRALQTDGDTVFVIVETSGRVAGARAAVRRLGGRVRSNTRGSLFVQLPISALETLASSPDVLVVRQPRRLVPTVVTSEGVADIGATTLQGSGITGAGVRVGIVDVGFAGYEAKLGSELPSQVVTWGAGVSKEGSGSENHGTAVAEVVHDVAPGAELYLAQVGGDGELQPAVDWMVASGVKVINMSAVFPGAGPGDGNGDINAVVDSAVSRGVFWANAIGNYRQRHWRGNFVPNATDARWLDFATGDFDQEFTAQAGDWLEASLTWKDSWTAASKDYDLYLYKVEGSTLTQVYKSEDFQAGEPGQQPYESISVQAPTAGNYAWLIRMPATPSGTDPATDVDFDLFDPNRNLEYREAKYSFAVPADNRSEGFVAAGAVGRDPFVQESYSSEGPTRDERVTPEIAAPSNVSNSIYSPFAGTSAASPHLAGAAALLLDIVPGMGPSDIEWCLETRARDLGVAGADFAYGFGLVDVADALSLALTPLPSSPATIWLDSTTSAEFGLRLNTGDDLDVDLTAARPAGSATITASVRSLAGTELAPAAETLHYVADKNALYVVHFERAADDTRPATFSANWKRTKASSVTLAASPPITGYGSASTLYAVATDSDRQGAPALVRFLYSYDGANWNILASGVRANGHGVAAVSFVPTRSTYLKALVLREPGLVKDSSSASVQVQRYAYLSTPASATRVRRNAPFSATGYLRPRHTAGTYPVRLMCYRYERGSWVYRKAVYARVANYDYRTSRYAGSIALPYAGKWYVRAYTPGDLSHAPTYSGVRYVLVNPTSLTISADRTTVTSRISATLRGLLRDVSGHALAYRYVYIERSYDLRTWTRIATLKTSSAGVVRTSVRPRVRTYYRFRYPGDNYQMGSSSPARNIYVR
jgi:hypothetical protein